MRRLACLAVMLLAVPTGTAAAQDATSLEPGQRVRVTAPALGLDRHEERVAAVLGDTLVLTSTRCSLADIERLDVHTGRRSYAVTGGLIGAAVGLVIGTGVGVAEQSRYDCDPQNAWAPCIPPLPTIPIMLGLLGGTVGAVTGAFIKTDRWEEMPLDGLRVSVAPRPGGVALGISIAF